MSLINGIAALGSGFKAAGTDIAKDEEDKAVRQSLLNNAPPPTAPVATAPTPATPALPTPLPDTGESPPGMGNKLDAKTIERAHQVYTGLTDRGMDQNTAIAFAANAVQESRANPGTAAGDMGASHGLLQWRGDRLANYIAKFGHPPEQGNLDEQLDFVVHELGSTEAGAYKRIQAAAADPAARAGAVSAYYERPKDTQAEIARRGYIANQLVNHFAQLVTG